jgi:hypothetical protein
MGKNIGGYGIHFAEKKINDGGPAYPVFSAEAAHKGMSLRDYFAGQALAAYRFCESDAAKDAYRFADAMIAERNKNAEKTNTRRGAQSYG